MKRFAAFLAFFASLFTPHVASGAVINVTFDETSANPDAPTSGVKTGYLVICDSFDVGKTCTKKSTISDYVLFGGGNMIIFTSDTDAINAKAADTGIVTTVFDGVGLPPVFILEPANGVVVYDATGNMPGAPLNNADTNHFTITSDEVPEPGTWLMMTTALVVSGVFRRTVFRASR